MSLTTSLDIRLGLRHNLILIEAGNALTKLYQLDADVRCDHVT